MLSWRLFLYSIHLAGLIDNEEFKAKEVATPGNASNDKISPKCSCILTNYAGVKTSRIHYCTFVFDNPMNDKHG